MIVCTCNNLNSVKIREAIAAGAEITEAVYRHHGTRRQCGKCIPDIETMLAEAARVRRPWDRLTLRA